MPLLQCDALTVRYPGFTLEPLSIEIRSGERVALVGPNGAGKSTTMRALGGRSRDHRGRVLLDGADLVDLLPRVRARIGYLPEHLLGFGWMTVREHLDFLAVFYPTWDGAYAGHLVEQLELDPSARLGTLSKGTRIKLSLVAAEAYRPPILLLDEPTSGIDPVMRRAVLDAITHALRDGDRLLVFSTHILEDVEKIADRVLVLRDGRLRADVTLTELRRRWPDRSVSSSLEHLLTSDEDESVSDAAPS